MTLPNGPPGCQRSGRSISPHPTQRPPTPTYIRTGRSHDGNLSSHLHPSILHPPPPRRLCCMFLVSTQTNQATRAFLGSEGIDRRSTASSHSSKVSAWNDSPAAAAALDASPNIAGGPHANTSPVPFFCCCCCGPGTTISRPNRWR